MSDLEAPATPDGVSAGTLLKQAREAAGLHVSTLAANLKVPVRKLEALEEDRYEELPDAVFVRALASSVCRTLKVDATPVLQRLPQTRQPRLAQDGEGVNAPFRSPADGPPPGVLNQVSRPVLLSVVALLLAALVIIFFPRDPIGGADTAAPAGKPEETAAPATASPPQQPAAEAAPAAAAVAVPTAPASPSAPVPAPAAAPPAPETAAAPGMQLRTSASTTTATAATPAPAASAAAAPASAAASAPINARGIVTFRTRAQSWVQVKDASGTTVMQRLMEPGETAGASGTLPLTVVVGSAESTEVQVRGKPFNLAPLARDNVARFEVK